MLDIQHVLPCAANVRVGSVIAIAVECSHSADPNPAAPGHSRPSRGRLHRPSNSLISTAVQPASPHGHAHQQQQQQQQPVSPKLNRANSVVSHTAPGARQHGGRAGTPASVYGQTPGFLLPNRARQHSPARLGAEQVRGVSSFCLDWGQMFKSCLQLLAGQGCLLETG
jgi:hypothetical protein